MPACRRTELYCSRTLASSGRRVADLGKVWPLGLDVAEQRLDPCLVGRRAGAAEVLVDGAQRHELAGGSGGHLRAVEFLMVVKGFQLGAGWPAGRASSWSAWRLLARCARPACGGGCGRC